LIVFLQSVCAMGGWVAGFCFWRFWRDSRDRLFALFAATFWLLALSWGLLALFNPTDESRPYVYGIRLVAFGLIIAAMLDKNRE
jgi:4-amino-4-deoxy-L-arabinose transferase-like glycosyltransferase